MRALLLVAAAMAAVRAQTPRDPVNCEIDGYTVRHRDLSNYEVCCEQEIAVAPMTSCYGNDPQQVDYCAVSHHYHCCGISSSVGGPIVRCIPSTEAECDADFTWCPTEPAEPADLDGATVGTIVVASLIGVALVGGAIAVHLEV